MKLSTIQKRKDTINYKKIKRLLPSLKGFCFVVYDKDARTQEIPFESITAEQCEGAYTPIEDYLNRLLNDKGKIIEDVSTIRKSFVVKIKSLSQD